MLADGFHDVPPGKVAAVVTHLEMRARPDLPEAVLPEGVHIRAVERPDVDWYRDLYLRVGAQDWLWFSRLRTDDASLREMLEDPQVLVFALERDGRAEGLVELDFRVEGQCELAYFGVTPALIGQGVGRAMIGLAVAQAFARPITVFHVHTCTLDSPQALGFYRRHGFVPVRQQIEVADDPRLTGELRRDAGAHVPVFDEG